MLSEEQQNIKIYLQAIAEVLYKNTSPDNLKSFESIELIVREYLVEIVAPEISSFFFTQQGERLRGEKEP
ncbi:MAG TPA: hypothetical protein VIQ31_28390, partial [Phormidium sp.]